jgi:hypothetical protein
METYRKEVYFSFYGTFENTLSITIIVYKEIRDEYLLVTPAQGHNIVCGERPFQLPHPHPHQKRHSLNMPMAKSPRGFWDAMVAETPPKAVANAAGSLAEPRRGRYVAGGGVNSNHCPLFN